MKNQQENRLWHWPFWGIYFLLNHIAFSPELLNPFNIFIQFVFLIHNAGTAYAVLDWWIPRYFQKKKYGYFFIATCLTLALFTVLLTASLIAIFDMANIGRPNSSPLNISIAGPTFWSNIGGLTFLAIPYFVLQRIDMERRNQQLEKEKLEAELQNLKSQLHPHFLFNALNNIYFLIKKDPDTAAEALAGFSDLLRFQLYETKHTYVPLEKEISYLQQFSEIAQLRKGVNFKVGWDLPKETDTIQIPPLLLMPLLENAFKHSGSNTGQIDIQLDVTNSNFHFSISNTKDSKTKGLNGFEIGGIGLENIQKRLSLLYPDRHQIQIRDREDVYEVNLSLQLKA